MENYRSLYKVPAKTGKLREEKRESARREQKKKREDTFFERRNIAEAQPSTSSVSAPAKNIRKHDSRREKLLRWKAEKEKLIAQQKLQEKKRPPFKVGVAHHALDPKKELVALPIRASTVKCTTLKKAAAESRLEAADRRKAKAPTNAASSLAALSASVVVPITNTAFSGRVTRSRSAATKTTVVPRTTRAQQRDGVLANSTKNSTVTACASNSKNVKVLSQKGVGSSTTKKQREVSFAPKDHKFKAPASLTFPTTPLALKRSTAGFKAANWQDIPGVSLLSPPVEPSPRKRRSRAVKEKTPQQSSTVEKSPDVESPPAKKMSRSYCKSRSGRFVVTDLPKPNTPHSNESDDTVESTITSSTGSPRKSMTSKPRQSSKGKENVREESSEDFSSKESPSHSTLEVEAMEPIISSSRRMSIHEPSPPVNVSPEKLINGMLPAQFSPFITSARGKDKYSIQKRRSSLIPIVPEVSATELAKAQQIEHFRNLLERESSRLLTLSALWEERKAEAHPVAQDKILGPVGQARLLVKDKFQQFRRLVDKFESGDTEGKITADDLTGFWEMMLLTVENVDKRFKELEDLKENNWEEGEAEAPVKKTVAMGAAVPKPAKPCTSAKSRIKDLIEAARKKKQKAKQNKSSNVSTDVATFDGGFFRVESPKKVLPSPKAMSSSPAQRTSKGMPTPRQFHRRSLLQQVLTISAVRARNSPAASPLNKSLPLPPSPKVAVAQMRASELGRRMSMDSGNDSFSPDPSSPVLKSEPTKSILKSAARKSLRINTPRNRVVFEELNRRDSSSPGSPCLLSPSATPPTVTPISGRTATPGNRRRVSLIPRLIPVPTPKTGDRASLLPVRESLIPSKPLPNGDLIDWSSPIRG